MLYVLLFQLLIMRMNRKPFYRDEIGLGLASSAFTCFSDSQLVVWQVLGEYETKEYSMQ